MLQWNENLATGDSRIDAEHREIFAQLNEIGEALQQRADPEVLTRLILLLLDYSYLHFHHEEHAMACAACPMKDKNCAAHRFFIERLKNWLAVINSGTVPVSMIRDIHAETSRWIQAHVETIDLALRATPPVASPAGLA